MNKGGLFYAGPSRHEPDFQNRRNQVRHKKGADEVYRSMILRRILNPQIRLIKLYFVNFENWLNFMIFADIGKRLSLLHTAIIIKAI